MVKGEGSKVNNLINDYADCFELPPAGAFGEWSPDWGTCISILSAPQELELQHPCKLQTRNFSRIVARDSNLNTQIDR